MREARRRIGELLVAEGLLSETVVSRALEFQHLSGDNIKLGSILLNWDLVGEDALLTALAKLHHSTPVPWSQIAAAKMETVRLLPPAFAKRAGAIAYSAEKGTIRVAFVNPSDIAAVDEAAAISGRRVLPGVTTELRMMQAHHRFHGGRLPLEYRAIIQRLERKAAAAPRAIDGVSTPDFRAGHVAPTERDANLSPARPTAVSIPVETGLADRDATPASDEQVEIEVPEMPALASPAARQTPAVPTLLEPPRAETSSERAPRPAAETDPRQEKASASHQDVAPPFEETLQPGEDSLAEWVGEALMSFQQDRSPGSVSERSDGTQLSSLARGTDPDVLKQPAEAAGFKPAAQRTEDPIADMWRPAPPDDDENVASGMWTSGEAEPGAELLEARSRDEIADTVLANSLTDVPRVVLLGIGRTVVTGWRGRGPGLTPEGIAGIRVPIDGRSLFAAVRDSGSPHFGPVDPDDWTPALGAVLGSVAPECAVFPIRVGDDVAAFLYADRLGAPMQYEDFAKIARAAASAAGVLGRFLLRQNTPVS